MLSKTVGVEGRITGSICKGPNLEVAWHVQGTERKPVSLEFNEKTSGRKLERLMGVKPYSLTGHVEDLVYIPEQLKTEEFYVDNIRTEVPCSLIKKRI